MASSELLNVVVIGTGLAGADAARALSKSLPASHRVVAISSTDAAYYPPGALRASVQPVSHTLLSALLTSNASGTDQCPDARLE